MLPPLHYSPPLCISLHSQTLTHSPFSRFHSRTTRAHARRYWSPDNIYATQNGGDYAFIVEPGFAIPTDEKLWVDLIKNATVNGMVTYEQGTSNNTMRTGPAAPDVCTRRSS